MLGHGADPGGAAPLDAALADTVRRTGASAGGVYLLDESAPVLGLVVLSGMPEEVAWPWRRVPLNAGVPVSEAVREDRLVWVGSQDDMARVYPRAAASLPYRFALAAAPLPGGARCLGALFLLWPASHPVEATRRERGHISSAARRIARIIGDAPALPPVPEHPRHIPVAVAGRPRGGQRLRAAADYVDRLPEAAIGLDLEGRITYLAPAAAALLGMDAGRLLGTRPWQSLPWMDNTVVEDHYRTAVISRDPVTFTTLRPPDTWLRFQLYPDASGISARVTRVRSPEGGVPESSGTYAARGLVSAPPTPSGRLYQLVHLAAALTETVAVRDVVDLVADQVLPAFGADGLVLSAADAGRLRITGHHGYDQATIDRLDGLPLDTDITPAGEVLASGVPSFFTSPAELARRFPDAPRISAKQAWAFLPLVVSGRPVGCCILSYDRPHDFSADERAVLTSLAGLVAQALDRARLYDTTRDLAHGLQQALLPRSLPALPGLDAAARYLPASRGMDIGGDFYDVIRIDATTAAAVIGDVQGHNVSAAALMGQVRTAIHATVGAPPGQVLARTNRVLSELETDLLVSCLYAHIDLVRQEAVMASAGHPPPLLHHPGRPPGVMEIEPGPLLGVETVSRYPTTVLPLPPGTTFALYTDGLVEIPGADPDRAALGLSNCLAEYSGQDLDHLIDVLLRHARPTPHYTDDIAVLLLRTAPPPA
ncbi:phosphatase [Streptomyces alfalfae]|uniref:Phosphatase n=1 Tax=Streptomyces alfalfae TaxID=1642299 RepID=A0ABM6H0X5_9ACTN|nr:SpoIIE family protein phosphatase [Streptomyces alfalfae]AYA20361.1 phosphatase [Streptomyces fradiae]APY89904.1 phosphatase [Streptomyces alfalfae]QUI30028.1 SpoIIE family protein phosphatase [Streptomyces alfalfae]RXX42726.1 phosphatase [Streptomyces alfalfae]RZM86447.1 phosphatase [Streptomyces alfalfae]